MPPSKRDDLIFDVGMHRGEDTANYLARGFNVVGVEANPNLVAEMQERFASDIKAGRLTIVSAAVAAQSGSVGLSVYDDVTVWSSLDPRFISRNEKFWQAHHRTVEVPAVRFADLLTEYGIPHYLKVDIEGLDMLCVRALHEVEGRPDYLSIESEITAPASGLVPMIDELAELWSLGYRGFKFVEQSRLASVESGDTSGPFGEETPGRWSSIWPALVRAAVLRTEFNLNGRGARYNERIIGRAFHAFHTRALKREERWWDLHAKLGQLT